MHSSCVSIRQENTAVLVAARIFLLYSSDGGIPRVRVQNSLMEMCETSSFWLWPRKALKRTRQKSLRPPSCCGVCSQRQWLTGTNNPPYCLLYIEFGVHHGTPWIFRSQRIAGVCMFCQSIYSLLTALQREGLSIPLLCWRTVNVTYSLSRPDVSFKKALPIKIILLLICSVCCACMSFATIFSGKEINKYIF